MKKFIQQLAGILAPRKEPPNEDRFVLVDGTNVTAAQLLRGIDEGNAACAEFLVTLLGVHGIGCGEQQNQAPSTGDGELVSLRRDLDQIQRDLVSSRHQIDRLIESYFNADVRNERDVRAWREMATAYRERLEKTEALLNATVGK